MDFLDINGDHLEGGGQILRTALAFSALTQRPVRVYNIRARRPKPGLNAQHLRVLQTVAGLFAADTEGIEPHSTQITFIPRKECSDTKELVVDIGTAGGVGLFLQPILLLGVLRSRGLRLTVKGGTAGLGQVPVDYYANCILPLLGRCGIEAQAEILRRGYYPQGGGEVSISISPGKNFKPLELFEQGGLQRVSGISYASKDLMGREVSQRQARSAEAVLKKALRCPVTIEAGYADTISTASEINLYAHTDTFCILGGDSRGEKNRTAERIGREAAHKLIAEIRSGAACDAHLADNIIPWLVCLDGRIKTSEITLHTQTNMWVAEQFFGKIFTVEGMCISCPRVEL